MIRSECIDDAMSEWPMHWYGKVPSREKAHVRRILHSLRELWTLIVGDQSLTLHQEILLRSLWILGFELSRDRCISEYLPDLPVNERIGQMIEDGCLLFGFYTDDETDRFNECCQLLERLLRSKGVWEEQFQTMMIN